jgi:FkbM family methyltransferase
MHSLKRLIKRNSHNWVFKNLAGFGRALNRFYENRNHDPYSNGELSVIKKISRFNPSVIIDGGANTGKYSLMIIEHNPYVKIYAFEPVESTFNEMSNNVKDYDNIIPVNKGLFSGNCTREINLYKSNVHSSIYDIEGLNYQSDKTQLIELICGDDFVEENKIGEIDFLKLDIEGAEYDALTGFKKCLAMRKIKAVQFEYGYINITTKKLLIDFYNLFKDYGYIVGKIFPEKVDFRDYEFKFEDFIGPNFIAVKKDETGLIESLKKK